VALAGPLQFDRLGSHSCQIPHPKSFRLTRFFRQYSGLSSIFCGKRAVGCLYVWSGGVEYFNMTENSELVEPKEVNS
jgi:hypothetical protein